MQSRTDCHRDMNTDFVEVTLKNANQMIGCCGLDCEKCDARIATITNDNALREKTVALWTKRNGITILPDMINCTGCRIEGAKTPFCDKLCPVHNCVREKGLDTCADCGQMDGCLTLGQIAGNSPSVLDNLKQLKQNDAPTMTVNDAEYTVIKLLGKGKGGYSYLVTDGTAQYVLKQIHHEPCDYYTFGDKLQSELRDYETLRNLGIPMPRLLAVDTPQERILKEYIAGQTVAEQLQEGRMEPDWLSQVQAMCSLLYPAGLNIDYYPTNFVPCGGTLYYIDYECNGYMEQWDFEHWGAQYWTAQTPGRTEKP